MQTTTYNLAVKSILAVAEARQAELDRIAAEKRAENIATLRGALLEGVEPESPAYPVCALVSKTVTIGREDGYPTRQLPEETKAVIAAAEKAGVLSSNGAVVKVGVVTLHADGGGFYGDNNSDHSSAQIEDHKAWQEAAEYRNAQTVFSL